MLIVVTPHIVRMPEYHGGKSAQHRFGHGHQSRDSAGIRGHDATVFPLGKPEPMPRPAAAAPALSSAWSGSSPGLNRPRRRAIGFRAGCGFPQAQAKRPPSASPCKTRKTFTRFPCCSSTTPKSSPSKTCAREDSSPEAGSSPLPSCSEWTRSAARPSFRQRACRIRRA